MRSLRFEGESDASFRRRVELAARSARILSDACLNNSCMHDYIADPGLPLITLEGVRKDPTVRIEYEQAIALGGIGETLRATRNKHWGSGPWIAPLAADDWFFPDRITYLYRENSVYNRRFEQRRRMKQLLGRRFRRLVEQAKYQRRTQKMFLEELSTRERRAIKARLDLTPIEFWRACRGRVFYALPPVEVQRELPFTDDE